MLACVNGLLSSFGRLLVEIQFCWKNDSRILSGFWGERAKNSDKMEENQGKNNFSPLIYLIVGNEILNICLLMMV